MRTFIRLLPVLAPFAALFACGLGLTVAQSLGFLSPVPLSGGPLDAYARLLEPHYLASLGFSLYVALVSAAGSTALGAVLAYGAWKLPIRLQGPALVYKIPLILPHIAVAFLVLVFWTKSGVVSSLCFHLGWVDKPGDFPSVLYGGTGLGMILAYLYKETPFVILLAWAVLKRLDPRLIQTAYMLGAGRWRVFRSIVLPHMRHVLHTTFIILFLYGFGAFDIPFLLGESSPGMLSIEAFNLYFRRGLADRPAALAILTLLFAFSTVFIVLYTRLTSRLDKGERKL